jgi:hypothetical protein
VLDLAGFNPDTRRYIDVVLVVIGQTLGMFVRFMPSHDEDVCAFFHKLFRRDKDDVVIATGNEGNFSLHFSLIFSSFMGAYKRESRAFGRRDKSGSL